MAELFTTILNMSLTASIIVVIVLLVRQGIAKAPKIYSYLLWAIVLFRLLCPVSFSLPVSVLTPVSGASSSTGTGYTASMEYISVPERREPVQMQKPVQSIPPAHNEHVNAEAPSAPGTESSAVVVEQQSESSVADIILTILGGIWVAGMVGVLGFTGWQTVSLRRMLADACIIRGNIFESEKIDTAFILGVISPKIYLPLDLPFDIQKAVVAHEQTHQRRGDHVVKLISYIALAIHWFNPLVWLSFKLMCDDMEKSCDEAVLREMCDRGYTEKSVKKAYGNMLLILGGGKQHIFSPVSFAENSTKSRVKNVVAYKRIARNMGVGLAVVCMVVALLCIVNPTAAASVAVSGTDAVADSYAGAAIEHSPDAVQINLGGAAVWSDIKELDLSGFPVRSEELSVLKRCSDLEKIVLGNFIGTPVDLSVLSQIPTLKVLELTAYCPSPEDISFIAECKSLEKLIINSSELIDNHASELDVLRQAPGLKSLHIDVVSTIGDLGFLEGFDQLEELELSIGIEDSASCSVIARLPNLRKLGFWVYEGMGSDFVDCSLIGDCRNLEDLDIFVSDESDGAEMFSRLSSLKKLYLRFSSFTDDAEQPFDWSVLSGLTGLTELRIDMGEKDIPDLTFAENMNDLQVFNLSGYDCSIGSIRQLEGKSSLRELVMPFVIIEDDYFPRGLDNLEYLDIYATAAMGENISSCGNLKYLGGEVLSSSVDFSRLDRLERIRGMILDDKQSCEAIAELPLLRELGGTVREGADFGALCDADGLVYLGLYVESDGSVDDISGVSGLKNLELFELTNAEITDISALSELKGLRFLNLNNCSRLSDISPLAGHPSLEMLSVSYCSISDVSPLATVEKLKYAVLDGNFISDVSALYGHKGLGSGRYLDISANGFERLYSSFGDHEPHYPEIVLSSNSVPDKQIAELYDSLEHHCTIIGPESDYAYELKDEVKAEMALYE